MIRGIDVSTVQGVLDWDAIAAWGAQFAIIKCTEGNKLDEHGQPYVDPHYAANVAGARKAGLIPGAYHFAYCLPTDPTKPGRSAEEQAALAHRLSNGLGELDGDLPPALDLEWPEPDKWAQWGCTAAQIRQWAVDAVAAWSGLWGCAPLVYTYPDWWMHVDGGAEPSFATCPLWMASYTHDQKDWPKEGDKPLVVRPWTQASVWQFSGGGIRLPNGTPVDGDVIADEETLHALTHS